MFQDLGPFFSDSRWLRENGGWLAALGGAGILLTYLALSQFIGARRRRARFMLREAFPEADWFDHFSYSVTMNERALLIEVLRMLGTSIGVDWTRFRLEDKFSEDFRLKGTFSGWDDLHDFESYLAKLSIRNGIPPSAFLTGSETIGDLLEKIRRMLNEQSVMLSR